MNRLQYALAALVAVAGIGSAFTTNQKKTKSKFIVLFWYKPTDLYNTIITATFDSADRVCPIYDPSHICLLGYFTHYYNDPSQLPYSVVTGWTH